MFERANLTSTWEPAPWSAAPEDTQALIAVASNLAQLAKETADGKITTFYQPSQPTSSQSPQTGDLWINTTDGKNTLKRYNGSTWDSIDNSDIATALANAATAQSTADDKIVTFAQTSEPTATDIGDIWIDTDDNNKMYRWNGSSWVDVALNVNVGGTNLWVVSASTFGYLTTGGGALNASSGAVNHLVSTMRRYIAVTPGEGFVYQHWNPTLINDTSNQGRASFYNSEKTYLSRYDFPKVLSSDGEYVVRYFTAPANAAYMRLCNVYSNDAFDFKMKVERGNTPTAYSPAPEDLEAKAAGTSSPNLCLHTKAPTADDITRTSETVVVVGNDGIITLQPNTSACYFKWKSYANGGVKYQDCNGKTYTVSFDARYGTSETYTTKGQMSTYLGINATSRFETYNLSSSYDRYLAQKHLVTDDWQRYRCSYVIPNSFATGTTAALANDNILVIQFGQVGSQVPILIKNIKLELGDTATEYAPAPEDTDNAINDAQHAADVANDTAQQALDDASTANTGLQSLKDNEIAALFDYVDTSTSAISTLNGELTGYKETADERLAALEAYDEVVGGHINIVDNNNEYYIDIGKQKKTAGAIHDFHLKLEGDRMVFYDGDTVMAYFHNSQLYAPDAIFATRAKIGNFAFVPRTTGNLSFMYVGGSE